MNTLRGETQDQTTLNSMFRTPKRINLDDCFPLTQGKKSYIWVIYWIDFKFWFYVFYEIIMHTWVSHVMSAIGGNTAGPG